MKFYSFFPTDWQGSIEDLVSALQLDNSATRSSLLFRQLQKVLKTLKVNKDFKALAGFLKVTRHQSAVVSTLTEMLLDLRHRSGERLFLACLLKDA
jgi:hypothetical protein